MLLVSFQCARKSHKDTCHSGEAHELDKREGPSLSCLLSLCLHVLCRLIIWIIKCKQKDTLRAGAEPQCLKQKKQPMNIVVISCTKQPFFLLLSVPCWYYTAISFACSSLVALERRRRLCAFMLVWARELSGEKRMANLGLCEVWENHRMKGKHSLWQNACVCLYKRGSFQSNIPPSLLSLSLHLSLSLALLFLLCWGKTDILWNVLGYTSAVCSVV